VLKQLRSQEDHKNVIEQGFTLVELLIVIVILGILAGIVVFAVGNLTSGAKTSAERIRSRSDDPGSARANRGPVPPLAPAKIGDCLRQIGLAEIGP